MSEFNPLMKAKLSNDPDVEGCYSTAVEAREATDSIDVDISDCYGKALSDLDGGAVWDYPGSPYENDERDATDH